MTLTSPPYDDLRRFGGHAFDFDTFSAVAEELYRITMPGGVVVWVVADAIIDGGETGTSDARRHPLPRARFPGLSHDVHDRAGSTAACPGVRYGDSLEYAFVLSQGQAPDDQSARGPAQIHGGQNQPIGAPRA